jgi:cytochrome c oxidase assembly protein subunit 15
MQKPNLWLFRFSLLTVFAALALILIGSLVTTNGAGMAFATWPLSDGSLNPPGWWDNISMRLEHGHRLFAGFVSTLVVVLFIWVLKSRASLKKGVATLAFLALLGVLAQALLGGLRVMLDPQGIAPTTGAIATVFRVLHGCFAQVEFALLVLLAAKLCPCEAEKNVAQITGIKRIRTLAWLTFGFIFLQLVFGAIMRHLNAGLAIPTFPKASPTGWMPAVHSIYVDTNFTHTRVIALLVVIHVLLLALRVFKSPGAGSSLKTPALTLLVLILAQVVFGISIIWSMRWQVPTTLHVVNGAVIFATALLIATRATSLASTSNGAAA